MVLDGGMEWRLLDEEPTGFDAVLGDLYVRPVPGGAEARWPPNAGRANLVGGFHGSFLTAAAEQCLILPLYLHGRVSRGGVLVIDLNLQFLAQGDAQRDLFVRVQLLRETGRLGFVRGEVHQDGQMLVAFAATLRKLSGRRPGGSESIEADARGGLAEQAD